MIVLVPRCLPLVDFIQNVHLVIWLNDPLRDLETHREGQRNGYELEEEYTSHRLAASHLLSLG